MIFPLLTLCVFYNLWWKRFIRHNFFLFQSLNWKTMELQSTHTPKREREPSNTQFRSNCLFLRILRFLVSLSICFLCEKTSFLRRDNLVSTRVLVGNTEVLHLNYPNNFGKFQCCTCRHTKTKTKKNKIQPF